MVIMSRAARSQKTPMRATIQYNLLISLVVIVLHLLTIIEIPANLLHSCLSTQQHNDESSWWVYRAFQTPNCCKIKKL